VDAYHAIARLPKFQGAQRDVRSNDMTATGLACGSCGTGLRAGDKFCHECAAPVVGASKPAEYKQVTVGENAWLRGTPGVGRGNGMTAVVLHPY
jgi:hypothetical protein